MESKLEEIEFKHLENHDSARISEVIDNWAKDH